MSQLPIPNGNELGTLFRLLSVFTASVSVNQPLTELQLTLIDDSMKSLFRFSVISPMDRGYMQSLKAKIDVYYGMVQGQIVTSNQ